MTQSNLAAATIGPATLSKVFSLAPSICLQIVTPQRTSYFENNNVAHSQQSKYDNCNGSFSPRGNIWKAYLDFSSKPQQSDFCIYSTYLKQKKL